MSDEDGWNWVWRRFHGPHPNGIGDVSGDSGAVGILGQQAPLSDPFAAAAPSATVNNSEVGRRRLPPPYCLKQHAVVRPLRATAYWAEQPILANRSHYYGEQPSSADRGLAQVGGVSGPVPIYLGTPSGGSSYMIRPWGMTAA
jgi:hypothetical protein